MDGVCQHYIFLDCFISLTVQGDICEILLCGVVCVVHWDSKGWSKHSIVCRSDDELTTLFRGIHAFQKGFQLDGCCY